MDHVTNLSGPSAGQLLLMKRGLTPRPPPFIPLPKIRTPIPVPPGREWDRDHQMNVSEDEVEAAAAVVIVAFALPDWIRGQCRVWI